MIIKNLLNGGKMIEKIDEELIEFLKKESPDIYRKLFEEMAGQYLYKADKEKDPLKKEKYNKKFKIYYEYFKNLKNI